MFHHGRENCRIMSALAFFSLCSAIPGAAENIYMTISQGPFTTLPDSVAIIDSTTFNAVATFPVPGGANVPAVTPGGGKIYDCLADQAVLSIINTSTNSVANLPYDCDDVAVSPDGSKAYVSIFPSGGPATISVLRTDTDAVVATIPVTSRPNYIVFSRDGSRAYVDGPGGVLVIDTIANAQIASIPGAAASDIREMAITPNGRFLYVAGTSANTVFVIDTTSNTVVANIPAIAPCSVAITPDGTRAYIGNGYGTGAYAVDTSTNTRIATIGPAGHQEIAISRDGTRAYISNIFDAVYVVDTRTNAILSRFGVPGGTPVFIAVAPSAPALTLSFQAFATLAMPIGPSDVAIGDFNRDGIPDIASTANIGQFPSNPARNFVFLGSGGGAFNSSTMFDPGGECWSGGQLKTADVNNDGFLDLILAEGGSNALCFGNKVSVQLGNGAGGFASPGIITSTGGSLGSFTVADFNEDGKLDVALRSGDEQAILILLGNGDGTFSAGATLGGGYPENIVAKDFNGDGHLDLAATFDNGVKIFLGNGAGSFSPPVLYPFSNPSRFGIEAGDFNEDGILDLAVSAGSQGQALVLLGTGGGAFAAPVAFPAGTNPISEVVVADFNRDGHQDIAVGNCSAGTVTVLIGDGHGSFAAPAAFPASQGSSCRLASADLNGDGLPDLVSSSDAGVSVLINNSYSVASTPPPTPVINSNPTNPTNQTSATFGFSDTQAGVTFLCSLDGGAFSACGSPQTYPGPLPQGSHSFAVEAKDGAGNLGTAASFTWTIDTTPPTISGLAAPPANGYGWNNANVTVSFTCSDALSGIASCSAPTTLAVEGAGQSVTGTAVDQAGNTAQATVSGINIDKTAPTVTYTGNAGTYTVDQTVSVTCTAQDSLSGVAQTTCQNIGGPAYSFTLGVNNFSAAATDRAGNAGGGSTSFTVQVTSASLGNLVNQFCSSPGIANALDAKLNQAAAAAERGDLNGKNGALGAFRNQVQAQTGKSLTPAQAAILIQLSLAL